MNLRDGRNRKKAVKPRRKRGVAPGIIVLIALVLFTSGVMANYFWPEEVRDLYFIASRLKNTFSFIFLGHPPQFYYLEIEKNGKDSRLTKSEAFVVSYRDEFVIKDISTDALFSSKISADVEGIGRENDFKVLLKGIDLVDKVIMTGKGAQGDTAVPDYRINVKYDNKIIAAIPLQVNITPQDWLRYARSTENQRVQIEYLKRAIAMNKEDTGVRKMLAGLYLRQGETGEAITQYRDILTLKPDDLTTLTELSKCYMKEKEYNMVIKTCRDVIRKNNGPEDASAFANMAFAYSQLGDWRKAVVNYRESLRLNPNDLLVRYKLGEAYEKTGKINEAAGEYRFILTKSPDMNYAMIALADLSLKIGNYDEAIKWYKEIIRRQPRNASAFANIGLAYGGKGLLKEEIESYQRAIALNLKEPVVHFNLAAAYEKGKRNQEATAEYQKFLKMIPGDPDALERIADIDFNGKRYDQAIRYYEKIVKNSKRKADIYANLGFAYGELKRYRQSCENYEKAIRYGNKDPHLHYNLAFTYDKLGRKKEAISEYEKFAASRPTVDVLNILSGYYIEEKLYDNAIRIYKKMINLTPRKADVYSNLGYVYGLTGDVNKEIEYYKTAIRYDREDDATYLNLGAAYEKKGMYQEALTAYTRTYELNPASGKAARKIPQIRIKMLQQKYQEK